MSRSRRINAPVVSDACHLIGLLLAGRPLRNLADTLVRRDVADEVLRKAESFLINRTDASSAVSALWLEARRGNGKTETLDYIAHKLVQDQKRWKGKRAVVLSVNLQEPASRSDLMSKLFYSMLRTRNAVADETVARLRRYSKGPLGVEGGWKDLVDLGLDFLYWLLDLFPGTGFLVEKVGTPVIRWLVKLALLRDARIKKILASNGVSGDVEQGLLLSWIRFALRPTIANSKELGDWLEMASLQGKLFASLCNMLRGAGYSSLVVLADEGDVMSVDGDLREALMGMYNIADVQQHDPRSLNILFVIACTEVCRSLVVFPGMPDDDGFSRRFFGAPPDHTRWTVLQSPVIGPVEEKDDLRHVENHAALLVNQCYGPPKRQLDTSVRADLRKRLARDDVTWHEVWGSVIKEFDRLQA